MIQVKLTGSIDQRKILLCWSTIASLGVNSVVENFIV